MAHLHPESLDLNHFGDPADFKAYDRNGGAERTDREFAALQEKAAKVDVTGDLTGALVYFGAGDGNAVYVVKKMKPLTLQHVYVHDGYQIPGAHVRGLTVEDVRQAARGA